MKIHYILPLLGLLLLNCCHSRSNANVETDNYSVYMDESDMLKINLDSNTTQETQYIQLLNDSVLAFFNAPTYEICLANAHSGNPIEKIKIYKDGPNAVHGINDFFIQNPDSIWLHASWGNVVFLIDNEGTLKGKWDINKLFKDRAYAVSPFPTTTTPYIVKDNRHYLQGMGGEDTGDIHPGVSLICNLSDSTVITGNTYPKIYGNWSTLYDNWITMAYLLTFYTLSPEGEIVTSFPASDSIYVYDSRNDTRKSYFAGYSSSTNIHPGVGSSPEANHVKFLKGYQYCAVLYDADKDVYYRVLRLPKTDYDASSNLRTEILKKKLCVIILDHDFKKIGEFDVPEDRYYTHHMFVNSRGLHINTVSDDDDYMTFRVFKLTDL